MGIYSDDKANQGEIRFKFLSDSVLKAFEKDGRKYCRLTESSNAEDLVGDVMSQRALEQMKSAAVGTVMFMNHSTNVPEDVFGTVAEATVEKKTADLVGGSSGEVCCLEYLVEVQTDNERAVKTWQMIGSGTKLGASVTVLVRDKSPNPKRSKGIIIEEVEYIETSIVGVPCNRQSWVSSAQKALRLAEKRASRATAESETEEEEVMSKENAGPEPRKLSLAFPLAVAAMEKGLFAFGNVDLGLRIMIRSMSHSSRSRSRECSTTSSSRNRVCGK